MRLFHIFLLFCHFSVLFCATCFKCLSVKAVVYWRKYGIPLHDGYSMTMEGNDECMNDNTLSAHSSCTGVCVTYNVTLTTKEHLGQALAVARECITPDTTQTNECTNRLHEYRRGKFVNLTSCYCNSDFCNGNPAVVPSSSRRAAHRRRGYDPNASTIHQNNLLVLLMVTGRILWMR